MLNISEFLALNTSYYGNDAGIRVRFETINHYWRYFKEYPFFGVGFLTPGEDLSINFIISGLRGHYNTSDVGIFGFLVQHGFLGIVWLVLWFNKVINICIKYYSNADQRQSTLVLILIVFFLFTLINLMFNAYPLFLNVPLLW